MILTIIGIAFMVWLGIKIFPSLWYIISGIFNLLTLPFALIFGFLSFLLEAGLFVGLLWLAVSLIGG